MRGQRGPGVERRTRQVLAAPNRLRREIGGWLNEATAPTPFLDLGCGPGMLLAAAAAENRVGIGIDVSMVWLVAAQRLIRSYGGEPVLAAGFAEALPLPDESLGGVVSLDVVEHVGDQITFLKEIDRVTARGGVFALATPNRFSVAAEPHVHVWGVGLVPRRWQRRYAEWWSGSSYAFTRLLSTWEMRAMIRRHTGFSPQLQVPPIPPEEIAASSPRRAVLARLYNGVIRFRVARAMALATGPFFRVAARKGAMPARLS